ncbi:MAG: hypothetical protein GY793_05020 [Proteobacteria bacterium]|nr:hypothetical protein [Pseudomonadota bacterium]
MQNSFAESFETFHGSISSNKVNVRVGPGTQYPISWVYTYKHWPIEAVAKHQGWYKIRDIDGEEGWIYQRFFSKTHYGIIHNSDKQLVNMYKKPDGKKIILRFESGSVVKFLGCQLDLCKVSYERTKGWIQKKYITGSEYINLEK